VFVFTPFTRVWPAKAGLYFVLGFFVSTGPNPLVSPALLPELVALLFAQFESRAIPRSEKLIMEMRMGENIFIKGPKEYQFYKEQIKPASVVTLWR
jgi:hypothetical protein